MTTRARWSPVVFAVGCLLTLGAACPTAPASPAITGTAALTVAVAQPPGPPPQPPNSTSAFAYAPDPRLAAAQREVITAVERYEAALRRSDLDGIVPTFASDAVIEWNGEPTTIGDAAIRSLFQARLRTFRFTPDYQYDAVDVRDDLAIVRTHHPPNETVLNLETNQARPNRNREVMILDRTGDGWRIALFSYTLDPSHP